MTNRVYNIFYQDQQLISYSHNLEVKCCGITNILGQDSYKLFEHFRWLKQ